MDELDKYAKVVIKGEDSNGQTTFWVPDSLKDKMLPMLKQKYGDRVVEITEHTKLELL